jgi:hypothetical protein
LERVLLMRMKDDNIRSGYMAILSSSCSRDISRPNL